MKSIITSRSQVASENKYIAAMRGGSRKGAGRPAKGIRVPVTVRLSHEAYNRLEWACDKLNLSQSDFIERQLKGI